MHAGVNVKSWIARRGPRALRLIGRVYISACTFVMTAFILFMAYHIVTYPFCYVELPNGARLANTEWSEWNGGVVLKNNKGDIVLGPHIGGIVWNDHYVMGEHFVRGKGEHLFIYKVGAAKGINSTKATRKEFDKLLKESGLEDETNYMSFPHFRDLLGTDLGRAWYE